MIRGVPKPPFTIGQNAAEYGRTKTPQSGRAKLLRLLAVVVAVVVIVVIYKLTR